jgi:ribosomal protein S12 methylthiotransferase
MLKTMQRETSGDYIRDLVRRIRAGIPGIAIRTTFIVGFPGETEADVDELCEFIRETKFERLGVFRYSQEEGTRAGKMEGQISAKEKESRWHRLMALQKVISADVSATNVGKTVRVLVDEIGVARGEADAPDIDGRVYVPRELKVGSFATVTINGHHDYDLLALPTGQSPAEYKVAKQAQ